MTEAADTLREGIERYNAARQASEETSAAIAQAHIDKTGSVPEPSPPEHGGNGEDAAA